MKWSIPKVLYIISRYYCPFYLLSETCHPHHILCNVTSQRLCDSIDYYFLTYYYSCSIAIWFHGFGGLIICSTITDLIVMIRVCACYGNDKK
ncbi:hypothetical protein BDQ17DRAFT_1359132, partial [Cyathus striatus]